MRLGFGQEAYHIRLLRLLKELKPSDTTKGINSKCVSTDHTQHIKRRMLKKWVAPYEKSSTGFKTYVQKTFHVLIID